MLLLHVAIVSNILILNAKIFARAEAIESHPSLAGMRH